MLLLTRKLGRLGWLLLVARGCLTSSTASRRSSCRDRGDRGLAASGTFAYRAVNGTSRSFMVQGGCTITALSLEKVLMLNMHLNMEENVKAAYV